MQKRERLELWCHRLTVSPDKETRFTRRDYGKKEGTDKKEG